MNIRRGYHKYLCKSKCWFKVSETINFVAIETCSGNFLFEILSIDLSDTQYPIELSVLIDIFVPAFVWVSHEGNLNVNEFNWTTRYCCRAC